MAGTKGSESVRSLMYPPGKSALLPPKIPFPSVSASYSEYVPSGLMGSSRHGHNKVSIIEKPHHHYHHQRTSSESHLVEEQLPFWLDDLLNEPESPAARKSGHRRSASDSYAYLEGANNATNTSLALHRNMGGGIQDPSSRSTQDTLVSSGARPCWLPLTRESVGGGKHMGASYMSQDATADYAEALSYDTKRLSLKENNSNPQPEPDNNTKRAKQQFAQRSRVRKLQYISELERNVQSLQAEGSKVSAELDFLNQRNLILSLENKALKQRLESIAQEKLIKQLEQEMLEREIGRLRALYQQQQQQQQTRHKRATSKDLDSQFSSLSLNAKNSNCRRDSLSVMGQFHS